MNKCQRCSSEYDLKEVGRIYGKDFALKGYCTPQCYTKDMMGTPRVCDNLYTNVDLTPPPLSQPQE